MDCSKCIALMATNPGDIWDYSLSGQGGKKFADDLVHGAGLIMIADVGCADLKMSEAGITKEELKSYPSKVHEVLGGDTSADPLPLSDEDYLTIFENAYK